jgi:CheY-like chemotaxis protein
MEKKQILVVEDEAISREVLKNCLTDQYDILVAENGDIALEILKKLKYKVAVILLDLRMPVVNGIRFLEKREQIKKLKIIPVIVALTTFETSDSHQSLLLKLSSNKSPPTPI